jgi:opacity protein-like surface antigen
MRIACVRTILGCVLLLGADVLAQVPLRDTTSPGKAPSVEFSAGYVFMNMFSSNASSLTLRGVDATGAMQFASRWGAMVDFTYARDPRVPGTTHSDQVMSALIGPKFFLINGYRTNVFVHGLIGSALVDSAIPNGPNSVISGYVARFSYDFGAGAEFAVTGPFAIRIAGDYQRTTFVDSSMAFARQNNVRATTSLVYRFGSR